MHKKAIFILSLISMFSSFGLQAVTIQDFFTKYFSSESTFNIPEKFSSAKLTMPSLNFSNMWQQFSVTPLQWAIGGCFGLGTVFLGCLWKYKNNNTRALKLFKEVKDAITQAGTSISDNEAFFTADYTQKEHIPFSHDFLTSLKKFNRDDQSLNEKNKEIEALKNRCSRLYFIEKNIKDMILKQIDTYQNNFRLFDFYKKKITFLNEYEHISFFKIDSNDITDISNITHHTFNTDREKSKEGVKSYLESIINKNQHLENTDRSAILSGVMAVQKPRSHEKPIRSAIFKTSSSGCEPLSSILKDYADIFEHQHKSNKKNPSTNNVQYIPYILAIIIKKD